MDETDFGINLLTSFILVFYLFPLCRWFLNESPYFKALIYSKSERVIYETVAMIVFFITFSASVWSVQQIGREEGTNKSR